ncbi:MAG: gfo/Idh/MocA family oxidoreductase, partial [Candidatus Aminicenantes bacterium]|nr:gfo/Idh/MocA family oxidoreductase [Candidatus Aminicenantes bacterium]
KRFAAVGYQWSFSPAIQAIKADILAGVYGKPQRLRCLYLWPRDETYYRRNDWAGRIRDERGRWVLDSPVNNAMAHDLHNMLYILGESIDRSVQPVSVKAELYRAYSIQNYDTVAGRVITQGDTEILVFFSHASAADIGPVLSYEFEKGTVMASGRRASLKGLFKDGRVKDYGPPDEQPFKKLWDSVAAVRSGQPLPCGVEAASSQTLCINGFQESAASIIDFPARLLERQGRPGSRLIFTRGLEEAFVLCNESGLLPSEMHIAWSRPAVEVSLDDYQSYPARKA